MEFVAAAKREAIAVLDKLAELDGAAKPDFAFVDDDCVRFPEVVEALRDRGFVEAARTEATVIFRDVVGTRILLHAPNRTVTYQRTSSNDAFDAAGLAPPDWAVFWCD